MASETEIAKLIIKIQAQTTEIKTALKDTQKDIASLGDSVSAAGNILKKVFLGLGITIGIRQISNEIRNTIKDLDRMILAAQKTGFELEIFSGLTASAERARVPIDYLIMGMKFLAQSMYNSIRGLSDATDAFKNLGINVGDSVGNMRLLLDVLLDISDKFSRMEDGAAKTAITIKLLGRSSEELINWLNLGPDVIKRNIKEAERFGIILDTKSSKAVIEFRENTVRLHQALRGLFITIANEILPDLIEMTDEMIDNIVVIKDFIRENKIFLTLPWNILKDIIDHFGELAIAIGTITAINLAPSIANWVASLGTLTASLNLATVGVTGFGYMIGHKLGELIDESIKGMTEFSFTGLPELEEAQKALRENEKFIEKFEEKRRKKNIKHIADLIKESDAYDRIIKKIAEYKAQITGLTDPQEAARIQLEAFIDEATKDIQITGALAEAINNLRAKFGDFYEAQKEKAFIEIGNQAQFNSDMQKINLALIDVEQNFKQGKVTIQEYYDTLSLKAWESAEAELDLLEKKRNETKDDIEKKKILLEMQKIKNDLDAKSTKIENDRENAIKKTEKAQREFNALYLQFKGEKISGEEEEIRFQYEEERNRLSDHYAEIAKKIRTFSEEKIEILGELYTKEQALAKYNAEKELALQRLVAEESREIIQAKIKNTQEVLSGFGDILSTLYQQSGNQSKGLFNMMKSINFAEALINAYSAYNKALKQGGGLFGVPMANMVLALGLAKAALILRTKPEGYAAGGLITGGRGDIDDIDIRGTRGEYMQPVRAVQYYGLPFMEAIKNLTIPRTMPTMATANAGGGGNSLTIQVPVNVDQGNSLASRLRDAIEDTVKKVIHERM